MIYQDYRFDPSFFFHDITGAGHIAKDNGLFPAVPGFDLATGVGTLKMYALITGGSSSAPPLTAGTVTSRPRGRDHPVPARSQLPAPSAITLSDVLLLELRGGGHDQ